MGAAEDDPLAKDDEKPQHKVYLNAYWIDNAEVTNVNFSKCLAAGVCHPKVYETTATTFVPYPIHPDYQDYPALLYEFEPAADYCQWTGRQLPTEAQWEKAARGKDARLYPWGNALLDCTLANFYACDIIKNTDSTAPRCGYSIHCKTTSVDDYLNGASPYGALNMAGNVWEWVADWYQADYYTNSPMNNPGGPTNGDFRVIRGGGAKSLSQELRVTERASGAPEHYMDGQMGFRCALDAGSP
jgi:formylglycine-generating enzyme required for sulfatase activity